MDTLRVIHARLLSSGATVSCAESCTGGLLSARLTSLSGSSAYFLLGCVTYSNAAKSRLLGIPEKLIRDKGAVSDGVCRKMAASVRALARSDFGIGITGIAGPTGAVRGKPAGTVYISVASAGKTMCRRFLFKGNRSGVRKQSCEAALAMLARAMKAL